MCTLYSVLSTQYLVLATLLLATSAFAQQLPTVHHRYQGNWPPGTIGQYQRQGDIRRVGYFQPVEILAPQGVAVSMAEGGRFDPPQPAPLKVGLQIGPVYRFRVTRIPLREGAELFPTLELIDRLHPPEGAKWRFPIPVELTKDELDLALAGKFVTRVIYVENPTTALAHHVPRDRQRYFEVRPEADPVQVADQLGRPIAILRIGSRVPGAQGPSDAFLYGSPPVERFNAQAAAEELPLPIETTPAPPRLPIPRRN